MKITPRAQGRRWRYKDWKPGRYVDVKAVSGGPIRTVRGVDETGADVLFLVPENDGNWECLPRVIAAPLYPDLH